MREAVAAGDKKLEEGAVGGDGERTDVHRGSVSELSEGLRGVVGPAGPAFAKAHSFARDGNGLGEVFSDVRSDEGTLDTTDIHDGCARVLAPLGRELGLGEISPVYSDDMKMLHTSPGPFLLGTGVLEIRHAPTKPDNELRPTFHKVTPVAFREGSEGYKGDIGLILEAIVHFSDVFGSFPVAAALATLTA